MTADTLADPDLESAFQAALNGDAQGHADQPPPPKREPWLNEDGTAKWGYKADGTARRSAPGPGRPRSKDDEPRTTDKPPPDPPKPPAAGGTLPPVDYTSDLMDTGTAVWMGMSMLPQLGAYAALWNGQVPAMASSWNGAAQKSAAVRKYVSKLSGEGGWTWVIPVVASTAPLVGGAIALFRDPAIRAQLAKQNAIQFRIYMERLVSQMQTDSETSSPGASGPDSGYQPADLIPDPEPDEDDPYAQHL